MSVFGKRKSKSLFNVVDIVSGRRGSSSSFASVECKPILIEIKSCRELFASDRNGLSDPYVKVYLGKILVHETKHSSKTLNPTFTAQQSSSFLLDLNEIPKGAKKSLVFKVKDHDLIGSNEELGSTCLSADQLHKAQEQYEFALSRHKGKQPSQGFITLVWRPATAQDIQRLESQTNNKSLLGRLTGRSKEAAKEYGPPDTSLLLEVVSCQGLPASDLTSSDPYVKVMVGKREVHKTKHISQNLNPIYTIKHKSLGILDLATKELSAHKGLIFQVKDYDTLGSNDELCSCQVPADQLLEMTGERLEFELETDRGQPAGKIALRCRPATEYDRGFLQLAMGDGSSSSTNSSQGGGESEDDALGTITAGMDMAMTQAGGKTGLTTHLLKSNVIKLNGALKHQVRPHPDPKRPHQTKFMTKPALKAESLKESKKWLDIGSGTLGRVYVEIICCDGLENKEMDLTGTGRNLSDPFVMAVFEDGVAKTDIIDDCLGPRWMPWTQRAFIFRMMHSSSKLALGVFDYDPGAYDNNDLCGRACVDISMLRPNTEYMLTYNLYENQIDDAQEAKGTITIRLRIELNDAKEFVLSNLRPPPQIHINVKESKDFVAIRQTLGGAQDLIAYSKDAIWMYVDELKSYVDMKYYVILAAINLVFWRGQVLMFGFDVPLHSLFIFLSTVFVLERPTYGPTIYFYGLAWFLVSIQFYVSENPNPWRKSKGFAQIMSALAGKPLEGPATIEAGEYAAISYAYNKENEDWLAKKKDEDAKAAEENAKLMAEYNDMLNVDQTADTNIASKSGGISIDPMKPILYPIQQNLALVVNGLRLVKNIFRWDEPYLAFFLTCGCIALGTVLLITPWFFCLRWITRLLAWGLLGPWMKFADIYWYSKNENVSEEDMAKSLRDNYKAQADTIAQNALQARILSENAQKIRDIKKELFGRYISDVPVLNMQRQSHVPLHSSVAKPYVASEHALSKATIHRVAGQHLEGDMIPKISVEDGKQKANGDHAKKD